MASWSSWSQDRVDYKVHDIEAVVDRIVVRAQDEARIQLCRRPFPWGRVDGRHGHGRRRAVHFSRNSRPTGLAYLDPEPNLFSFNSPMARPTCNGLGKAQVDPVPGARPQGVGEKGGIAPFGQTKDNLTSRIVEAILVNHGIALTTPAGDIPEAVMGEILYGSDKDVKLQDRGGVRGGSVPFEGLVAALCVLRKGQIRAPATLGAIVHAPGHLSVAKGPGSSP